MPRQRQADPRAEDLNVARQELRDALAVEMPSISSKDIMIALERFIEAKITYDGDRRY